MVEGAGLGLALSARLANLMGGTLGHVDNPGGGSVFWLELPTNPVNELPSAANPASDLSKPQAQEPPFRAFRVLLVDDVLMNRDVASSFLRLSGHLVVCAESGEEGVAAAADADFDVVLMDVRMPGIDGLEATRRIRALQGARGQVPIVALTAQAFTEQVAACRAAGMDSHLSKPFDPETLLAAVTQAVRSGRTQAMRLRHIDVKRSAKRRRPRPGPICRCSTPTAFDRTAVFLAPEAVAS